MTRFLGFFHFMNACTLLLCMTHVALGRAGGDDWPAWGGPHRNFAVTPGVIKASQRIDLKIAWKKGLGSGYSAVSVRDGLAVTMFSDSTFDYAIALDANDGTELWRFKIDSTFPGRFGSANGPISTPLISESKVVGLGAAGRLFALDRSSGELVWDSDLVAEHQAKLPFYGFTTSALLYNNILLVETGGMAQNAISAFDPNTGEVLWNAGTDTVEYQSPYLLQTGDGSQFVGVTNRAVFGLQPESGKTLWRLEHGGTDHPMGAPSGNIVPVGGNQFFLKNTNRGGLLFKIVYANEMYQANEIWQTKAIKGTYVVPVYHDGHLFGYNSRILSCVNAETGERVWRSRAPGDGLPIVVDGHLVVVTKDGRLSVAPASPAGYDEIASLDLFDNLVWAPPSFSNGRLFLRSMTEIAGVDIVPAQSLAQAVTSSDGVAPESQFAQFVQQVNRAEGGEKENLISNFIAAQKEFPIVEGNDLVHFIYRGEAKDVALMGDLVGWRFDWPMHRVSDTNMFYYSARLESDARLTYKFVKDLQTQITDSLNTRSIRSMFFGQASWFSMPEWKAPDYFQDPGAQTGRIDSLQFKSALIDSSRLIEVYLPHGYDVSSEAYPVAYVHGGGGARALGNMTTALDNLIGERIQPVIVVFMPAFFGGGYREFVGSKRGTYTRVFVEEILPQVERTYRVLPGRENRANIGHLLNGFMAFYSTFQHHDLFGKLGLQSLYWDEKEAKVHGDLVVANNPQGLQVYFDWGKYDLRSPLESVSVVASNRSFAELLQGRGYRFEGGEVHAGTGWGSWKNRIDRVFATLFPISTSGSN